MRRSQSEGKKADKEEKNAKDSKVEEDEDDAADEDADDELEDTFGMSFLWDIALKAWDTEVRAEYLLRTVSLFVQ